VNKFGQQAVDEWKTFASELTEADIPGLSIVSIWTGKPTLNLRSSILERIVPILRVRTSQPAVRDMLSTKLWDDRGTAARQQFRSTVLQIPGTSTNDKGETVIPTRVLTRRSKEVIQAIRQLSESVDGR